jgi:hypothetical protein
MEINSLISQIKENIDYQEGKLAFLWSSRETTNLKFLQQSATQQEVDPENATVNQALTDALLNAMASLIDYYCMYCFLKMGVKKELITNVQYRPMNNYALLQAASFKASSLDVIKARLDEKLRDLSKLELNEICIHDYWPAFYGDAIASALAKTGIITSKKFEINFTKNGFEIDSSIRKYHHLMYRFYSNQHFYGGVKYNIYMDINNCLKHNIVPYVTPKFENYEGEMRAFSYVEFKKSNSLFLKQGLLKTLVELDFDILRDGLKQVCNSETRIRSELEVAWGMDDILRVDKRNGYLSDDQKTLYFFIDNILMAKTREATYVDVGISLKKTLGRLLEDMRLGMNLDLSEFG